MKRYLAFALMLVILLALPACSGSNDTSPPSNSSSTDTNSDPQTSASQTVKDDTPSYSLSDVVIVDDENCIFTVTGVKADGFWGFTLNVLCENNTDKNLMFSWESVSVNGYMVDPFWATEVAAGKKANSEISFSSDQLEKCNITTVDEMVFTLRVYDSDDWSADRLVNDEYAIYPTGLDADSVTYPERTVSTSEQIIIDNEGCTFIIEGVESDGTWGYSLNCYLVNKTSDPLMFSWNDVSVNGYMVDPFWATEVAPGKRAFSDISFSNSDFETNGISEVEDIEFKLRVYNPNDWSATDICNEVFTYAP